MAYNNFQIGDTIKSYSWAQFDSHIVGKIIGKKNGYFTLELIDALDDKGNSCYEQAKHQAWIVEYKEIGIDKAFDQIGKARIVKVS